MEVGTLKGEVGYDEAKMWLRRVSQRSGTLTPPGIWLQGWLPQLLEAKMVPSLGLGQRPLGGPKRQEAGGDSEVGALLAMMRLRCGRVGVPRPPDANPQWYLALGKAVYPRLGGGLGWEESG